MARPRLPDSVKKARGTLQPCRVKADAPKPPPGKVPAPPKGLSVHERELWKELAEEVEALGTFSAPYLSAFRLMVQSNAAARYPDPRDPATAKARVEQTASALLQRFGLDPASSGKVSGVQPEKKADTVAEMLFGGPPKLEVVSGE